MIIAGAGGHALEVLDVLKSQGFRSEEILFFDEAKEKRMSHISGIQIITEVYQLKESLAKDFRFCLGVGNPDFRIRLTHLVEELGGRYFGLKGQNGVFSYENTNDFDLMPYSYLGPKTEIGKGVLVNTRANVHHECKVGEFSEIGPGAMLLGAVQVGKRCKIGAGAVVLPGVILGDGMVVGAGAVVTRSHYTRSTLVGIPAKILT